MEIFNLKNIKASYGKRVILKNINIGVNEGDFIGIIGKNGCGKSTLLKILSGVLKPVSGKITFLNKDISGYPAKELSSGMSVVYQALENIVPFKVIDFILSARFPFLKFWENYSKKDILIAEKSMEITDTLNLADRSVSELSQGEFQLVSIARALTQNDKVILLDEPISNLDINHTMQIMDLLYKLNKSGTTVISVLHDINITANFCKRIIAIKNKEIITDGPAKKIITKSNIKKIYDINCSIKNNDITGKPNIILHPEYTLSKGDKK